MVTNFPVTLPAYNSSELLYMIRLEREQRFPEFTSLLVDLLLVPNLFTKVPEQKREFVPVLLRLQERICPGSLQKFQQRAEERENLSELIPFFWQKREEWTNSKGEKKHFCRCSLSEIGILFLFFCDDAVILPFIPGTRINYPDVPGSIPTLRRKEVTHTLLSYVHVPAKKKRLLELCTRFQRYR